MNILDTLRHFTDIRANLWCMEALVAFNGPQEKPAVALLLKTTQEAIDDELATFNTGIVRGAIDESVASGAPVELYCNSRIEYELNEAFLAAYCHSSDTGGFLSHRYFGQSNGKSWTVCTRWQSWTVCTRWQW